MERCELLFCEALDGLEAAKEPITLRKADGTEVVVPGDLRARAAFVRAARDVLSLDAELSGVMDSPGPLFGEVRFAQVIMLPKVKELEPPEEPTAGPVVDALPEHPGEQRGTSSNLLEEKR